MHRLEKILEKVLDVVLEGLAHTASHIALKSVLMMVMIGRTDFFQVAWPLLSLFCPCSNSFDVLNACMRDSSFTGPGFPGPMKIVLPAPASEIPIIDHAPFAPVHFIIVPHHDLPIVLNLKPQDM